MTKTIALVFAATLLGGCAMKEFSSTPLYRGSEVKFTGKVEDRVNLWPLAYYREPVGSVAWPLVSWGDDHLAFRPLYSQYKQRGGDVYDEFNLLWPIGQFDTKHDNYRVFPFFWGKDIGGDSYCCLFPVMGWCDEFACVMPFCWSRGGGGGAFCVFPLFWTEWTSSGSFWNMLFPLYGYSTRGARGGRPAESSFWAACGLAGYKRRDGEFNDHRLLPLYFWERGDFYSLPYSRYADDGLAKSRFLCGLAGSNSSTNGEYQASWLFPLYCHDADRFVTPLFGRSGDANWAVPLYWRDKETFVSLPYCCTRGKDGEMDSAFSLPLLSGYSRDRTTGDRLLYLLLGLGGHVWNDETGGASWVFPLYYNDRESFYTLLYGQNPRRRWLLPVYFEGEERLFVTPLYGRNRKTGADWLVPLYYHSESTFVTPLGGRSGDADWLFPLYYRNGRSFLSLPFGRTSGGGCTNTYFAAGLAGLKSGRRSGGWLFPLFDSRKDAIFDERSSWLDLETLPVKAATGAVFARSCKTFLLVVDDDRQLAAGRDSSSGGYEMTLGHAAGNRLVFRREGRRRVVFDRATREKTGDEVNGWSALFGLVYNHDYRFDRLKGTSYASHRVLWKLWDWEEENGDVSLDVFPGFTYDSKKSGYRKTSLLWRLFRHESDPEKGTSVDLLFLPVWRP
ncbi:MAG: hypothetical protein IJ829_03385 [Kiritimatiellae bacterium]|nr:hypothetical protein [Kiritimatiellia bacterium]